MGSQIVGFTAANTLEVDAGTKAARTTLRPADVTGIYSLAAPSGIMAAALGSQAPIFSFRWANTALFALVHHVTFTAATDATLLAAGAVCSFEMWIARNWTASDSGGTTLTPSGNQNKLRTSMPTSALADARIATTATLTAGVRTLDQVSFGIILAGSQNIAGAPLVPPRHFWEQRPGEYPLILEPNEGFFIRVGGPMPATGTWRFGVRVHWSETTDISSYISG